MRQKYTSDCGCSDIGQQRPVSQVAGNPDRENHQAEWYIELRAIRVPKPDSRNEEGNRPRQYEKGNERSRKH